VPSRLLQINRALRFAPTGETNLLVDEVEVLQLEKEKLEHNAEYLSLTDRADFLLFPDLFLRISAQSA